MRIAAIRVHRVDLPLREGRYTWADGRHVERFDSTVVALASFDMLAFATHTACDTPEALWQEARKRLAARRRFFDHIRTAISASLCATRSSQAGPPCAHSIDGQAPRGTGPP